MSRPAPATRRRSGFTVVEASLCVAVVSVLLVASTAVFGTIARARATQTESRLGTLLAGHLMAEILQEPFQQPGTPPPFGPQSGQTRATFNSVDAYDGYAAAPPASGTGVPLADYAGWSQRVTVGFVDPAAPANPSAESTLKRITVVVTAPSKKIYTLVGWRSKFGAGEWTPATQTTFVTGVAVSVQAASPAKAVYVGAHPLNPGPLQ